MKGYISKWNNYSESVTLSNIPIHFLALFENIVNVENRWGDLRRMGKYSNRMRFPQRYIYIYILISKNFLKDIFEENKDIWRLKEI